jgi:hypothetical protein
MAMGERIGAIDFWRGALQIVILVDHIPGSFLNRVTPMNFGFSDALEAFVFLSGISTGLAYLTMESRFGKVAVAYACAKRALKIYGVHVAVTLGVFLLFAVAHRTTGVHAFAKLVDLERDFGTPHRWLAFFALQYQPYSFCVLPLYVVLMLLTPIAIVLAARDPGLAVTASFAIYLAARMVSHLMPEYLPQLNGVYYNPFAWQLLFTIGISCTAAFRDRVHQASVGLLAFSASMVLAAAVVETDAFRTTPGLRDATFAYLDAIKGNLDADKANLGFARLVHFLALAYLVAAASNRFGLVARFVGGVPGQTLQALGRNSLAVFTVGLVLAAVGRTAIDAAAIETSGAPLYGIRMACVLTSITLLVVFGLWIDRNASSLKAANSLRIHKRRFDFEVTAPPSARVIRRSAEIPTVPPGEQ